MTRKTSIIWKIERKELQSILDESSSFIEVLEKIGYNGYNGNHRTLTRRLNEEKFDLTKLNENRNEFHRNNLSVCRKKRGANHTNILLKMERIIIKP